MDRCLTSIRDISVHEFYHFILKGSNTSQSNSFSVECRGAGLGILALSVFWEKNMYSYSLWLPIPVYFMLDCEVPKTWALSESSLFAESYTTMSRQNHFCMFFLCLLKPKPSHPSCGVCWCDSSLYPTDPKTGSWVDIDEDSPEEGRSFCLVTFVQRIFSWGFVLHRYIVPEIISPHS